jgi:hypothetical protein
VRLRQLVLVTKEIDSLADQICELFELKISFCDPELIHFGLENRMIPVGDTFIEVVSPVQKNTTAERFLIKRNGPGGYMVIVDVEDFEHEKQRIKNENLKIIWHENRNIDGIHAQALHLHPKQIGGAILSLDSMIPESAWLWAGTNWRGDINKSLVDNLTGVVLKSQNPEKLCANWEVALGKKRTRSVDEFSIELEKSNIKFIEGKDGLGESVDAFILSTRKSGEIYKRAKERGFIRNNMVALGGVNFILSKTNN